MRTRYLLVPAVDAGHALAARVKWLTAERSVLVVAARIGLVGLRREYEEAGVDMGHVFILDAISGDLEGHPADTAHAMRVPGPTSLELIAARAERTVRRLAERPATVLIDDLDTFLRYNGANACAQMVAYSKTHLLGSTSELEIAVQPTIGPENWALLSPLLDQRITLEPDGRLGGQDPTTLARWRGRGLA